MKVMQLVPAMAEGGVERGVVEMNRVFAAVRWSNTVVSSGGRLVAEIERDGGRHILLDLKSKNPFTYFIRANRLRRILEMERPDAVCAHSRVPAWLFVWANRALRIPWITFAHGANSVSRYSRVMTKGDLTVTPSTYIADYLKAAYAIPDEKIRVIPRAIESGRFDLENLDAAFVEAKRLQWGIDKSKHCVVMGLGRITQLKGYDTLVRAMDILNRGPRGERRFRLVIVGEAEKKRKDVEADLKALVKGLGLEKDVVFAGNQQKVAECLSLADIVVSANTKKPEAFGRSMAEALAMGKPVVARAFGGALDVVRDGVDGLLVGEGDYPALFAEAIRKVSTMKFGDLRKSAFERFSFDRMAKASIEVYKEVAR